MAHLLRLASIVALALAAVATPLSPRAAAGACANPSVVSSKTIGGVLFSTLECPDHAVKPSTSAVPDPVNVCGDVCNTFCGSFGPLPPITEDCAMIVDATQVFASTLPPTFIMQPGQTESLSYGTCEYYFTNNGTVPLEGCWTSFMQQASAAGTICFPPTQPINSLGACKAPDGTWELGAEHSLPLP
ncbi:hypothetical protein BV25DRAFT_1819855 [Artomyces pyxidatus]|uniref:Uncharacterized protein n=1 Tax=Artomyces pyxidatus TaxID=48021 RepID=A0ACB8TGG2_9AGAM|nr:hypothetical protein BV25DRAFT_1819855 [Artomyces pyxidatus]